MATFTVTNLNDSGAGSLRQAILDANDPVTNPGADTITFADSLTGQTVLLTSGELVITDDLTIDGDLNNDGLPDLTVQRDESAPDFRIFTIDDGNAVPDKAVALDGLTITGGRIALDRDFIADNAEDLAGGGILSQESLAVRNSTISSNTLSLSVNYPGYSAPINTSGGGIFIGAGDLTVSNSTISNNISRSVYQSSGGGIYSLGETVTVTDSTISGNVADAFAIFRGFPLGGYSSRGGGIVGQAVEVTNSVVSNNSSTAYAGSNPYLGNGDSEGGGISGTIVTVSNSVVSGNLSSARTSNGGGIAGETVTVNNSTVDANSSRGGYSTSNGGGIAAGYLVVNDSTVSNNSADVSRGYDASGGGLFAVESIITNSRIVGNRVSASVGDAFGGGVRGDDLTIRNSTISGNVARGESDSIYRSGVYGASAFGGGIFSSESAFIQSSTVNDNRAYGTTLVSEGRFGAPSYRESAGGGIFSSGDVLIVSNSTLSGNEVGRDATSSNEVVNEGSGGGIEIRSQTAAIGNSTIANNTANELGSGVYSAGQTEVVSTIVAGNSDGDVSGSFVSSGNNLIGTGATGTDVAAVFNQPSDLVNVTAPGLEALTDNGGPTQTQALQPGSPAIDAGSNPNNLSTDQRGDRFDRVVNGQADIGAFEVQQQPTVLDVGLFDADSDSLITFLENGDEILGSTLEGRSLTIAAFVPDDSLFAGQVESIFLDLNNGHTTRRENVEPYSLFGDVGGDLRGGAIPVGENEIDFELYSRNGLRGDLLSTVTLSFTIVDDLM